MAKEFKKEFQYSKDGETISVIIIESIPTDSLEKNYCSYLWPSAHFLASYLLTHTSQFVGKTLLEIGSGCALPGLLANKLGINTIFSEDAKNDNAIDSLRRVCCENQIDITDNSNRIRKINWKTLSPDLFDLPKIDVLIGSDLFFKSSDFSHILWLVAFLIEYNNRNLQVLMAVELRSTGKRELLDYLLREDAQLRVAQYCMKWRVLDLDEIALFLSHIPASAMRHDVHIICGEPGRGSCANVNKTSEMNTRIFQ